MANTADNFWQAARAKQLITKETFGQLWRWYQGTREGIAWAHKLHRSIQSKNVDWHDALMQEAQSTFDISYFTKLTISKSEQTILGDIASMLQSCFTFSGALSVRSMASNITRKLADLAQLVMESDSGPIQIAMKYADELAAKLGFKKNEYPSQIEVEYTRGDQSLIMQFQEHPSTGGIVWRIKGGDSGRENWPLGITSRTIQQMITNIFVKLPRAEKTKTRSKSVARPSRAQEQTIIALIAILASSSLIYVLRKTIARTSRKLYAKFQLLMDDFRKDGWLPGKRLSQTQRVELLAFLQGLTSDEFRRIFHATKDIKPLGA